MSIEASSEEKDTFGLESDDDSIYLEEKSILAERCNKSTLDPLSKKLFSVPTGPSPGHDFLEYSKKSEKKLPAPAISELPPSRFLKSKSVRPSFEPRPNEDILPQLLGGKRSQTNQKVDTGINAKRISSQSDYDEVGRHINSAPVTPAPGNKRKTPANMNNSSVPATPSKYARNGNSTHNKQFSALLKQRNLDTPASKKFRN